MHGHHLCQYHIGPLHAAGGSIKLSLRKQTQKWALACTRGAHAQAAKKSMLGPTIHTSIHPSINPSIDPYIRLVLVVCLSALPLPRLWSMRAALTRVTEPSGEQIPYQQWWRHYGSLSLATMLWRMRIAQTNIMHPIDLKQRAPQTIGHQRSTQTDHRLAAVGGPPSRPLLFIQVGKKTTSFHPALASSSAK